MNFVTNFFDLKPLHRFWMGFGVSLLFSSLWPFSLYWVCVGCPNGWFEFSRILRNELTFTIVHPLCFSPALGLLLATISKPVLQSLNWHWLLLLGLLALVTFIAYRDIVDGPIGAHQANNASTLVPQENRLRDKSTNKDSMFESELDDFLKRLTPSSGRNAWELLNFNGRVSGFLTWFYLVFVTVFVWYAWACAYAPTVVVAKHIQLILVAILIVPWIPVRLYVDWYINHWQKPNFLNAPLVFGVIVALMMILYLFCFAYLAYVSKNRRELAMAIGGIVTSAIALLCTIMPKWVQQIHDALDTLTPQFIFAILVLGVILILALSKMLLESPNSPMDLSGGSAAT